MAIKEIRNLAVKNECFGELDYSTLTQEMKDKALPLLMFMVMKRSGELKSRVCANGSFQWLYMDKSKCTSLMPDFYAFKYICRVIVREKRNMATVDLPGFFLQTERNKDDELIILKLTGAVALLLVESDEDR